MVKLCLSYDATTEYYKTDIPFRVYILKILIDNGATEIESHVKSTVYYTTDADMPLTYWASIFEGHMDEGFFYTMSIVAQEQDGSHAIEFLSKRAFRRNFKTDLLKARKLL